MIPCISQATTLPASFEDDIRGYADGGCAAVELWLTKVEQHLAANSVESTVALLSDRGVKPLAASYQGGLLLAQGEARFAAFDLFKRRLDLCQCLGVSTLVVVPDFIKNADGSAVALAVASLREAGRWAAAFEVRLALEFRGHDSFCTCLETAAMIVAECGEPNVGLCFDAFHYFKGPSKAEDLKRLTPANLFHVQLCDVGGQPREWMTDADRIFPGDGDFVFGPIIERLKLIEYAGAVSLELLNPSIWGSKPSQIAELGMASLTRLWE